MLELEKRLFFFQYYTIFQQIKAIFRSIIKRYVNNIFSEHYKNTVHKFQFTKTWTQSLMYNLKGGSGFCIKIGWLGWSHIDKNAVVGYCWFFFFLLFSQLIELNIFFQLKWKGQERFGTMTRVRPILELFIVHFIYSFWTKKVYYKEAVGAFVVFDVTRVSTFETVAKWKTDVDSKVTTSDGVPIPVVLLANKVLNLFIANSPQFY